ncbi:hypothetical protein GIS00_14535 [Nakamurella sp. YIM 132087]|uniref:Uncharacterized protein n=1 Tax=Nakamurella alba TaxID=2665158 RepID=A0A7K1FM17_9ACTN|nr:hypothetical protein [Nakamurella alba]MTD15158.1 hypothetical protein [Nakamurella alba]
MAALLLAAGLTPVAAAAAAAVPLVAAPPTTAAEQAGSAAADPVTGTFSPVDPVRLLDTRTGNGAPKARIRPGASITVAFTGRGGIPGTDVRAVAAALTVVGPGNTGTLSVAPDGDIDKKAVVINFAAGKSITGTTLLPIGFEGQVVLTNVSAGYIDLVADVTGWYHAGNQFLVPGAYVAVDPVRQLDTRTGNGAPKARLAAGASIEVAFTRRSGIPSNGVGTVVSALTVVGPGASGTLAVAPKGAPGRTAVVINFAARQSITATALMPMGEGGRVVLTNRSGGPIDLVADTTGWFRSGAPEVAGGYASIDPARLLDTRTGQGASKARVRAGGAITVSLTGRFGVPATGVSTVLAALTVVAPSRSGSLAVAPAGSPAKRATVVNFTAGQGITNSVLLPTGEGRRITLTNNSTGPIDLVADGTGFVLDTDLAPAPNWNTPITAGGTSDSLWTLSCPSENFCLGSDRTRVQQFDGTTWKAQLPVVERSDITCVSSSFCAAITGGSSVAVWNGASWSSPTQLVSAGRFVRELDCASSTMCMAAADGTYYKYDGLTWSSAGSILSDGLVDLECPTTTWCMAMLGTESGMQLWNGVVWSAPIATGFADFSNADLVCTSPTFCMLTGVDYGDGYSTFDGATWSEVAIVDSQSRYSISGLSCWSSTGCLVGGSLNFDFRFDGSEWAPIPALNYFGAASCFGPAQCMMSFGDNTALWTDGVLGERVEARHPEPGAFSCADDGCMVLVSGGSVNENGDVFPIVDDDQVPAPGPGLISCSTMSDCIAVGIHTWIFDGSDWTETSSMNPADRPHLLTCANTTFCMSIGTGNRWSTYDGTSWTSHGEFPAGGPTSDYEVTDVSCSRPDFCVAVVDITIPDGRPRSGTALTWDGTAWSDPTTVSVGSGLTRVACVAGDTCVATGLDYSDWNGHSFVAYLEDGVWTDPVRLIPERGSSADLSCASANFCVSTDIRGRVLTFNGATWSPAPVDMGTLSDYANYFRVSCSAGGHCGVVNRTDGSLFTTVG